MTEQERRLVEERDLFVALKMERDPGFYQPGWFSSYGNTEPLQKPYKRTTWRDA